MNPHEALVTGTREWIERAQSDVKACDALIAAGLAAEALFHAQQCAERTLKAILTWHQVTFKRTHDLDELKQLCLPFAGAAATFLSGIKLLSQYAWRFRYPGAPYSSDQKEAEVARDAAWLLLDAVTTQLESEFD